MADLAVIIIAFDDTTHSYCLSDPSMQNIKNTAHLTLSNFSVYFYTYYYFYNSNKVCLKNLQDQTNNNVYN